MIIEELAEHNLMEMASMAVELFPESSIKEEKKYYASLEGKESEDCFLAQLDGKYAGFIHLKLRNDYVEGSTSSPVAYLEAIYVKPDFRKTGLGRQLVDYGEEWGKKQGCTEYASDTAISNSRSINFHKSIGFREAGRNVCFIKNI